MPHPWHLGLAPWRGFVALGKPRHAQLAAGPSLGCPAGCITLEGQAIRPQPQKAGMTVSHCVLAGPGGDPIRNPAVLPTGKNIHALDPQSIPTQAALKSARIMVER